MAVAAVADARATVAQLGLFDFEEEPEPSWAEQLIGDASWARMSWIALVLALATLAFFTKKAALRWVSLAVTFVVLGYVDGGFLSVSHITSAIWVGPSVFLGDLALLVMVTFTVVTLVLWGRIFCGYLCPFGALQDFIDALVPKRFQRELPRNAHRVALKAKYGILAIIVLPALAGSETSLYQYFEPFGTVFSIGPSRVLWTIAGGILLASAIVPRFYCRYACPLERRSPSDRWCRSTASAASSSATSARCVSRNARPVRSMGRRSTSRNACAATSARSSSSRRTACAGTTWSSSVLAWCSSRRGRPSACPTSWSGARRPSKALSPLG